MRNWLRENRTCGAALAAVILAWSLTIPAAAVPIPSLADRFLTERIDRWYESAVRTMLHRARLAGVRIDPDVKVALTARGHVFAAPLEGFEELDLLEDARDGVNVGFVYLSDGAEDVPAGFYVVQLVVSGDASRPPEDRDAVAWLIGQHGDRFRVPLLIGADPNPERGPRQELTTTGGSSFGPNHSIAHCGKDGSCTVIQISP